MCVENQEACAVPGEQPLDELEDEPAEPVSAGHDNLSDTALLCSFQNGEQTVALEIDPGADVADDLVVWVALMHKSCLSFKIVSLFCTRYSNIDDILFCNPGNVLQSLRNVVTSLIACCPADAKLASAGPSSKSESRDTEQVFCLFARDISFGRHARKVRISICVERRKSHRRETQSTGHSTSSKSWNDRLWRLERA